MTGQVDEKHLRGILGSAGKSIASLPGAKGVVARMRAADSSEDLAFLLQSIDLGMGDDARTAIVNAASDKDRWREVHATMLQSAEQQLIERFSASS